MPLVLAGIIDIIVGERSLGGLAAEEINLPVENLRGNSAPGFEKRGRFAPAVRGRIVNMVEGEVFGVVAVEAPADRMNFSVHDRHGQVVAQRPGG